MASKILKVLKPYLVILKLVGIRKTMLARFPRDFYAEDDQAARKYALRIRNRVRKSKFSNDPNISVEIDKIYQIREI